MCLEILHFLKEVYFEIFGCAGYSLPLGPFSLAGARGDCFPVSVDELLIAAASLVERGLWGAGLR